jgi:sulfoxide reductase catalytic subunit YedY
MMLVEEPLAMLIRRPVDILSSEITEESVYHERRRLLKAAGLVTTAAVIAHSLPASASGPGASGRVLPNVRKSAFSTDESPNSWSDITTYNNYYEFGTGKDDPYRNAGDFEPKPWSVTVGGECDKPGVYDYEDLVSPHALEERIYRLRCVEAWSMVIPWVGIPLADILGRFEPNSKAKYVRFRTLHDPSRMPGQRRRTLDWPYQEGLTIDEAMHPLSLIAVGLYGRELPNQNGAPMRLVVPWKYGFKSIKAITGIAFTRRRPRTSWEQAAPSEYGFYANVNPDVAHPRWSQARERVIGAGLFNARKPTQMFNGYGEQVASLYTGLDLRKNF